MLTPVQQLRERILSGVSLFRLDTHEEFRAMADIEWAARQMIRPVPAMLPRPIMNELLQFPETASLVQAAAVQLDADKISKVWDRLSDDTRLVLAKEFAERAGRTISWDCVNGFSDCAPDSDESCAGSLQRALERTTAQFSGNVLFVFKDCHPFLRAESEQHEARRTLRDIAEKELLSADPDSRRAILFLSPSWTPHNDIAHYLVPVEFPLPDDKAIDSQISYIESCLGIDAGVAEATKCPAPLRHRLRSTLRGLTAYEINNVLGYGVRAVGADGKRGFSEETLRVVQTEKAKTFAEEQCLSWVDTTSLASFDRFGGFDNYIEWIDEVAQAYEDGAAEQGLKPAKGVLLIGVPGSGKSVAAIATAKRMQLPLLKLDFSSVMGQYVGDSERNMRRALSRISAEGECVLLIDEADKAFSNVGSALSGNNVEQRVFGQLLSWMANDNHGTFIIMTMNRTDGIPVETIRAGRLSAIFSTDLPTNNERRDIFRLKLEDAKIPWDDISAATTEKLVNKTQGYVGAEIEQIVERARWTAWKNRKGVVPTDEELLAACEKVKPASVLDPESISRIRSWCEGKAEPVSKEAIKPKIAGSPALRRVR